MEGSFPRTSMCCGMQDARGTSAKHGLSDAITRANLYTEVGADCALVQGPRSTYELQTVTNHTTGFRAVSISEGGLTPSHSYQQLKEMGFHLVRCEPCSRQVSVCICLVEASWSAGFTATTKHGCYRCCDQGWAIVLLFLQDGEIFSGLL
jgi:hypothetical protein